MSERLVFRTVLNCGNCGEEWGCCHPKRVAVEGEYSIGDNVAVINKKCTELGMLNCDCCRVVRCPNCDLAECVTVKDRHPIPGEMGKEQ